MHNEKTDAGETSVFSVRYLNKVYVWGSHHMGGNKAEQ